MKTKSIFLLTFLLVSCLASAQSYIPLQQHMQGVSGAEKITNLAEVEADLGRFTNLSATTGILSTANAQTLNVTGNATVNGFNYTASPTLNGASSTESTSTSVAGGIWNGDFSEGEGITSSSGAFAPLYGDYYSFYNTTGSISIINGTLKYASTAATSAQYMQVTAPGENPGYTKWYPLQDNTTYKLSARYKIESSSATSTTSGLVLGFRKYINGALDSTIYLVNYSPTVTDWKDVSTTITTASNTKLSLYSLWYRNVGTAYIDDIKLEQVTTHTNNSTTPTVAYPVITGVSSEFVDQQQTSYASGGNAVGNSGGVDYQRKQTFTPTQQKLSAVSLYLNSKSNPGPTGNLILEVRNPSNAIIASVDIENSIINSYTAGSWITLPIFALVDSGISDYAIIMKSDVLEPTNHYWTFGVSTASSYANGMHYLSIDQGGSWTSSSTIDFAFKTHYAENTRQITLTNSNTGTSTTVDWGDDGLPDGAVVDMYNGTMSWGSTSPITYEKLYILFNSLIEADNQTSLYPGKINRIFNGWSISTQTIYGYGASSGTKNLVFKFPLRYIKDATFDIYHHSGGGAGLACDYSFDNSSWISAFSKPSSYGGGAQYTNFNVANNYKNFIFIRVNGAGDVPVLYNIGFTATLDTSAIAPLLLAAGSNTINQSVNGGSYKANVVIKSVSGGFQTTLNEANKQLTVLRNAPRSYLETPDKTTNAIVVDNEELVSISGPVQVNGATIMNASTTPAYDIALPYNSGGAIGSSWNTYSETKYKNIISDVTEASYAGIASRLAGVQSKMVTRKIPDAVKAKFFDAEIEWVTDVVSVTEELKTQVVEPVYEVVKMGSKVTLDSKATEEQLLTAKASPKIVSYVTKEVSVLRSPGEYPRQEFRGWKVRAGVDEATKKQLENLYLKPHPEPIADTAPEAYRVPEGFAWSKWIEESTLYHNWILPQIINEIPQLRKRLEALESSK